MKYLENERLNTISSELSDVVLGDSHRIIQGRIEAYSMKRGGKDKKFAYALGQKYLAEMEDMQEELAATVERVARKRSNSDVSLSVSSFKRVKSAENTASVANDTSNNGDGTQPTDAVVQRRRSKSFDFTLESNNPKTTLGDFSELSTRRLMTDLILTLNSSFPDYDFSNVKPSQFQKVKVDVVRKNIYAKLSELASQQRNPNWLVELWMSLNEVIELKECDVYSFDFNEVEDALWSFHYFFVNKNLKRVVFFTCNELIDEEEIRSSSDEEQEERVRYYNSEAQLVDDFDWDPSDNVAGGMSFEVTMS
ncbi:Maf-like septum formation family protein [Nitzschia inconspicua]|uniref:Repressor of RNA polymerase III transcription n=1 Tax=Nitzschia inconspicua TaxID=303405 RepID=A0A9K3PLK7_9STRA|nr:Maf-like septum formation family protein [Nitzschia inconspicua]